MVLEYHFAEGRYERLPELAANLVSRRPAVILAGGGIQPVQAAKGATSTIPIVFTSGVDPVSTGVVASLNRPGGNITGVLILVQQLDIKRAELLREMVPSARVIGMLANPKGMPRQDLTDVVKKLDVELRVADASSEAELDAAFASFAQNGVNAVLVAADPSFVSWRKRLIALAASHSLPAIYESRILAEEGGLASYGPSYHEAYRLAGLYVARILKGDKPSDLPVQLPTKFEFLINLKTAKALGLTIPSMVLARADEVIE